MRARFVVHMSAVWLAGVNHRRRGSLSVRIMQEVNQELIGSVSGDLVSETKYFEVADAADQTVYMCVIFLGCFLMQRLMWFLISECSELSEREQDVR